jgi:adenosylmethionine-8-amino-7-oxononanoate aminotransferase
MFNHIQENSMYHRNAAGEYSIVDRREMLRVKIKSLVAEAKIIRHEEAKTHGALRDELHFHRISAVRGEARSAHLAYGFIRGRTYEQMEAKTHTPPYWKRVRELCRKYGPAQFVEPEVLKKAA